MKNNFLFLIVNFFLLSSCCQFDPDKVPGKYSCTSDKGYEEIILRKNNTFIYYAQDKNNNSYLDSGCWVQYNNIYGAILIDSIKDFLLIYTDSYTMRIEQKDTAFYQKSSGRLWHFRCNEIIERFPDRPYDFKRKKDLYYLKTLLSGKNTKLY